MRVPRRVITVLAALAVATLALPAGTAAAAPASVVVGACTGATHATIQGGVDAAKANPGPDTVSVCPGVFAESVLVTDPEPLTLSGSGVGTTMLAGHLGMSNIALKVSGTPDFALEGLTVGPFAGHGVQIMDAAAPTVSDVEVTGVALGLHLLRTTDGVVTSTTVSSTIDDAVRVQAGTGNRVERVTVTGSARDGIELFSTGTATVVANAVEGAGSDGIKLRGLVTDSELTRNTVVVAGDEGIDFSWDAARNTASNNRVEGAGSTTADSGVLVAGRDNTVVRNRVTGSTGSGITVSGFGNQVTGNQITTTVVAGLDTLEGLYGVANNHLERNAVKDSAGLGCVDVTYDPDTDTVDNTWVRNRVDAPSDPDWLC